MRIAGDAGRKAMADAGLEPSEIDGLMSYQMSDSVDSHSVATYLGITPRFYDDVVGGGSATETLVAEVIALIELGVVLPYELSSAGENDGMIASRHMYETGTTEEHLGAVCISIYEQARANPRARFYGHPLTIEQYLSSPHISGPYRIHDYCTETDEGNALIMTSAARARNCKTTPDYVQHVAVRGSVSARPSVRLARHNRDGRGPRRPTGVRDGRRWSRRHPRDGLLRLLQLGRTRATRGLRFVGRGEAGPFAAEG